MQAEQTTHSKANEYKHCYSTLTVIFILLYETNVGDNKHLSDVHFIHLYR